MDSKAQHGRTTVATHSLARAAASAALLGAALVGAASTAGAQEVRIVAEKGDRAIGFAAPFVYQQVDNPSLGRGGHLFFTGRVDRDANRRTDPVHAAWTGVNGSVAVLVREGDTISGLGSAKRFRDTDDNARPVVSATGRVAFRANLSGGSAGESALVVSESSGVRLVVTSTEPVVGFATDAAYGAIDHVAMTDAGLLFRSDQNSSGVRPVAKVLWAYNLSNRQIRAVATDGAPAVPAYTSCNYRDPGERGTFGINSAGTIVFSSQLVASNSGVNCPSVAVFRQRSGQSGVEVVARAGDGVPGMSATLDAPQFTPRINDAGDVLFFSGLRSSQSNARSSALFVAPANGGALRLVALQAESLPGGGEAIRGGGAVGTSAYLAGNGEVVFATRSDSADRPLWTLKGMPRTSQPYGSFDSAGPIQLAALSVEAARPVGYPADFELKELGSAFVNATGQAVFGATVGPAGSLEVPDVAVWRGTTAGNLQRLAYTDGPAMIGSSGGRTILSLAFPAMPPRLVGAGASTEGGLASAFSDSGQVVLRGSTKDSDGLNAILLAGVAASGGGPVTPPPGSGGSSAASIIVPVLMLLLEDEDEEEG